MAAKYKPKNRRERRSGFRRAPDPTTGLAGGRCWCGKCNGQHYPAAHLDRVRVVQREKQVDIAEGIGRWIAIAHTRMFYECVIEANARPDREETGEPIDTSVYEAPSASAQAIEWVEAEHYSGVDVDLGEMPLEPESLRALSGEAARLHSLEGYLITRGLDQHEIAAKLKRYLELKELFRGNRLRQWVTVEFPGWLEERRDK